MENYLDAAVTFIRENAFWAGPAVAVVAFSEAVPILGILMPGTAFLIAVGALMWEGILDPTWIVIWAVPGAYMGNVVSYFLGAYFQDSIPQWKLVRKRPEILERARAFVVKHGGKSILVARFFGPLRCSVPLVAGMLSMPSGRFHLYSALSALVWAPAVLIWGGIMGGVIGALWQLDDDQWLLVAAIAAATAAVLWYARARLIPLRWR